MEINRNHTVQTLQATWRSRTTRLK